MDAYINYGNRKINFKIPSGWNVMTNADRGLIPGVGNPSAEVDRALDAPIGSPRIEDMVRPGQEVTILFDDLQRPTPADLVLPTLMNRLNRAGIPDDRIKGVCALGTHAVHSIEQMTRKIGAEAAERLKGRLFSHDPHSTENILIGRTKRGTLIEINPHVALADISIGVGECMPHPAAGYGGGYKLLMPGVCSYRTVADHHYTWMRHPNCRVNMLDGNHWWEEIVDAGRLSNMHFKIDLVVNEKKEIVKAFAGDPVAEQKAAAAFAESLYVAEMPKMADVTITAAFPMEIGVQSTKALDMACFCTRKGGGILWAAPQHKAGNLLPLLEAVSGPESANEYHRLLARGDMPESLSIYGISYVMQVVFFKDKSEKFDIIHVTDGLTSGQVQKMKFGHETDMQTAVDRMAARMPKADVAIFPSGGNVLPKVIQFL